MDQKKQMIKELVKDMITMSHEDMLRKIDKVLNSGCIDIENWDADNAPMIIPKCIVTAILKDQSRQYEAKGTSFEKQVKKEVDNISYFL